MNFCMVRIYERAIFDASARKLGSGPSGSDKKSGILMARIGELILFPPGGYLPPNGRVPHQAHEETPKPVRGCG